MRTYRIHSLDVREAHKVRTISVLQQSSRNVRPAAERSTRHTLTSECSFRLNVRQSIREAGGCDLAALELTIASACPNVTEAERAATCARIRLEAAEAASQQGSVRLSVQCSRFDTLFNIV